MATYTVNSSAAFANAVNPVIRDTMIQAYRGKPDPVPSLFGTDFKSDRDREIFATMSDVGVAQEYTGQFAYTQAHEGYTITAVHLEFGLAMVVERKLFDDAQSHSKVKQVLREGNNVYGLGGAMLKRRCRDAYRPWNQAFQVDSYFSSHSEGKALCSATHLTPVPGVPTTTGFSNYSTAAISRTALAAARHSFRLFRDYQGEPMDMEPDLIRVPVELRETAEEITRTPKGLDTAGMNYNPEGNGAWKIEDSVWLSRNSATNWFVEMSSARKENLKWLQRIPNEFRSMRDFQTLHFLASVYARYSQLWKHWSWILGHQVT